MGNNRKKKKDQKEPDRVLFVGKPEYDRCDNQVVTSRYTVVTFLPVAITEQFRRFANLYFLIIGFIMAVGYYSPLFESAISPWTTLGPLAIVITFSLLVEGSADVKRHRNDMETNNAPCVVLRRADELDGEEGAERDPNIIKGKDCVVSFSPYLADTLAASFSSKKKSKKSNNNINNNNNTAVPSKKESVRVAFQKVRRMDIHQGHLVLIKNREMVPADVVLLASCNDQGSAFIETSSIDGETNLKLRLSPRLPNNYLKQLREGTLDAIQEAPSRDDEEDEEGNNNYDINNEVDWYGAQGEGEDEQKVQIDSIEDATKRLTRFSYLGRPDGQLALYHPDYAGVRPEKRKSTKHHQTPKSFLSNIIGYVSKRRSSNAFADPSSAMAMTQNATIGGPDDLYVAALTTEPPNPSVHTFMGKITLPPLKPGMAPLDIPLDADNVLLRGAVIRNTEWVIGVVFFTGTDTKLVQNSVKTKSKFSQLDQLLNKTVLGILFVMICLIIYLASYALTTTNQRFEELWYTGYNRNLTQPWPYLKHLPPPKWRPAPFNWVQYFFLYVTLLNNFVPLSLYVTVEFVTMIMLLFVYTDIDMYDDTTNTRAVARSTIVSDLGRIQYIFSDKTGTLTQNVMRFKRCSVDGIVFGAPIQKTRPTITSDDGSVEEEEPQTMFHPLRQLLVGRFKAPRQASGLEGLGGSGSSDLGVDPASSGGSTTTQMLTFNAEMFLRVMSLCHTVVVEKDIDLKEEIGGGDSVRSGASSSKATSFPFFNRKRTNTNDSLPQITEEEEPKLVDVDTSEADNFDATGAGRSRTSSVDSLRNQQDPNEKSSDGAPIGYAYQAESPDEGALVSAASKTYGFQVVSRDSSGITLRLTSPSHLQSSRVVDGFKAGTLSVSHLAAESAEEEVDGKQRETDPAMMESMLLREARRETWTILAVNKFDSDRKRMSILLRSPKELGDVPILFCKGADTAMLDPEVCSFSSSASALLQPVDGGAGPDPLARPTAITHHNRDTSILSTLSEGSNDDLDDKDNHPGDSEWEIAQLLGLQAHLGDFASEGLRTLVLGMRVLTENECQEWMEEYKAASTSLKNRSELLSKAASNIERNIHIVGATAIEDKLQKRVPETIATLEKAGIKLWVLTGDKRETAVEIGYSTHVLTPKMHLTEVPDQGKLHVQTQIAMEFIRLIKMGKLVDYQKASLSTESTGRRRRSMSQRFQDWSFDLGKCWRALSRWFCGLVASFLSLFGSCCKSRSDDMIEDIKEQKAVERTILKPIDMRRNVRDRAEKQIKQWLQSDEGKKQAAGRGGTGGVPDDTSLASEETPAVFSRASSAKLLLQDLKNGGRLSGVQLRELSLAQLTVNQAGGDEDQPLVDEDTLSMDSFFPGNDKEDLRGDFDKKKRTILERLFAIDRDVRKGKLVKHVKSERLASIAEHQQRPSRPSPSSSASVHGPRALVIEGAALKHLLGDPEMEGMLFAVASNCDAVIACRVSPKQKAQLLNLVRLNVKPEPITLAIGDGANDVGMIQEAHVGVGISGKEGKQAVNSSDFAIAQFRFLEDLLLVHGRWNFFRQASVILFSFYKNATMACVLIVYADETLYSGTPLFDEWLIAVLNFVAVVPIIVLGLFDRVLDKDYVKKHPEVYKATRANELLTVRTVARWLMLVIVHVCTLYYFTVPPQVNGGGMTSAWGGLMSDRDRSRPGNGEGGDLKSVGTVTFTALIVLLAYKVLYESRSLIHGRWPAFTCRKDAKEGFWSRLAYTWHGVAWGSIGFYLWAITVYALIGRIKPSQFSAFTDVTFHVLGDRSLSWLLILFVPFAGMAFDVVGKLFSNMYYPTQTQIHIEIEQKDKAREKKRGMFRRWRRSQAGQQQQEQNTPVFAEV